MTTAAPLKGLSPRPVFIGGLMKSGTSLLRVLLGQHPNLFATLESHWFTDDVRLHWDRPDSRRMSLLMELFDLTDGEYQGFVRHKNARPEREFIDIVLAHCAARAGKARWVEKTPYNLRHFDLIRSQWPDAILIHVTREYRDTFASWKARRGDDLQTFLDWTGPVYDQVRPLMGRETDHYLEVDYFDLVVNTEQAMRRILDRLGEPWDEACGRIKTDRSEAERRKIRKILNKDSLTSVSLAKPIFTHSICQWRELITAQEAEIIHREMAEYYDIYGKGWQRYERFCPDSGPDSGQG